MPKKEKNIGENLEESFKKVTTSFASELNNVLMNFSKSLEDVINKVNFGDVASNLKNSVEKTFKEDLGKGSKSMKSVGDGLNSAIDASAKKLGSGSFLKTFISLAKKSIGIIFKQLMDGLDTAFREVGKLLSKLGLGEVFEILSSFVKDILSGNIVSGIIGAAGSIISMMLDNLIKIDKSAENISKHIGVSHSEMFSRVRDSFTKIQSNLAHLGVLTDDIEKNFIAISDAFATTEISDKFLTNISLISAKTGLTGQEAADAVSSFQSISGSSKEGAMNSIGLATNLAKSSKTPLKMVINDIAKNSGVMAKYSGKFLENNIRAAISAKKLGLSISDIAKSADSLLNIEESVAAQFEASVLLGRDINLDAARYYSLVGNLEGVQKEILKIVGSEAEFTAMLPLQRQALAKALGKTEEELGKIIGRKKEEIEAEERMNKSMESAKKTAIDLYESFGGEKLVGYMSEMKSLLESIGNRIMSILFPTEGVKGAFEGVLDIVRYINDSLGDKNSGIYQGVEAVREFFSAFFDPEKTNKVEEFFTGIYDAFKWIKDNGSVIIGIITSIVTLITITKAISLWKTLQGIMTSMGGMSGIKENLGKGISGMFEKGKMLKIGKGILKGGGLGLASFGLDAGRNMLDNRNSGFGKTLGVASSAAEWASYGAMLGSVVPGLGTGIGAAIGGISGLVKGLIDESGETVDDFHLSSSGVLSRGAKGSFSINKNDDIIGGTNLFRNVNSNNRVEELMERQNKILESILDKENKPIQLNVKSSVPSTTIELENLNNKLIKNVGGENNLIKTYGI